MGAWHLDGLADWLSVVMWLWLWLWMSKLVSIIKPFWKYFIYIRAVYFTSTNLASQQKYSYCSRAVEVIEIGYFWWSLFLTTCHWTFQDFTLIVNAVFMTVLFRMLIYQKFQSLQYLIPFLCDLKISNALSREWACSSRTSWWQQHTIKWRGKGVM
jgi:hypothetical protein